MPASALAVVSKAPSGGLVTLFEIEEQLLALADTQEMVPPELEQAFLQEFAALLTSAADKRDRVGQFMNHLEAQIGFAKSEMVRLRQRQQVFEHALDRMEHYVIRVIQAMGPDAKGKPRKLEGNSVTLSIRKCPDSVDVTDESAVPLECVTWTFKLPASLWEPILDSLDMDLRAQVMDAMSQPDVTISKTAVKKAIEAGGAVAGAHLVTDKFSLVRK